MVLSKLVSLWSLFTEGVERKCFIICRHFVVCMNLAVFPTYSLLFPAALCITNLWVISHLVHTFDLKIMGILEQ